MIDVKRLYLKLTGRLSLRLRGEMNMHKAQTKQGHSIIDELYTYSGAGIDVKEVLYSMHGAGHIYFHVIYKQNEAADFFGDKNDFLTREIEGFTVKFYKFFEKNKCYKNFQNPIITRGRDSAFFSVMVICKPTMYELFIDRFFGVRKWYY